MKGKPSATYKESPINHLLFTRKHQHEKTLRNQHRNTDFSQNRPKGLYMSKKRLTFAVKYTLQVSHEK